MEETKKEVAPTTSQIPTLETKKINYPFAGRESLREVLNKSFPVDLIPTERIGYILGVIFLIVVIISISQIPFNEVLKGNSNLEINVGTPWYFLEFNIATPKEKLINFKGLAFDLIFYLIIAYLIDVSLRLFIKNPINYLKRDRSKYPQVLKDQKPRNLAEKTTKKIFEKEKVKI